MGYFDRIAIPSRSLVRLVPRTWYPISLANTSAVESSASPRLNSTSWQKTKSGVWAALALSWAATVCSSNGLSWCSGLTVITLSGRGAAATAAEATGAAGTAVAGDDESFTTSPGDQWGNTPSVGD